MTLIPSTSDTVGENLQPDEIPAPLSMFMESATENWERFRHAAVEFSDKIRDTMTMSEVIRQISNGCFIKFIAVIGLTGAGKSSVIKALTEKEVYVEHGINAGTTSFHMYPAVIQDQRYVFVDTPGFNDPAPTRTDLDIFLEILVWFRAMSPYCDLAGILYVHDIQTARNSASTETNLNMLKELCGEEFFPNVTILTTKWSRLAPGVIYQSENTQREFEEGPWRQLIAKGAQVFQHRCGVIEPTKNEILTEQRICDLQQQRKKAKGELERMICYYQYTKSITPKIQRELREGIGILMTGAGMVLQRSAGWPPTPDQVDNEAPRPADYGGDTSSRQPSSMIHVVHHHIETLTATTQPPTQSSGMTPQVLDDVTDSPPPMTWWSSLVLAVRWFILRRLIPSGSNSYFQLRVPQF